MFLVTSQLQPYFIAGIAPLCHVRRLALQGSSGANKHRHVHVKLNPYRLFSVRMCVTFFTRSGTYTKGAALSSSPPDLSGKENTASSVVRLSPRRPFAWILCFLSLPREILKTFNHLKYEYGKLSPVVFGFFMYHTYLPTCLSLCHGSARCAFMASPCSGGISRWNPPSLRIVCLSSFGRAWISSCS